MSGNIIRPYGDTTGDGMVHVTFTYTPGPGETIKHVWFNEEWVKAGEK